MKEYKPFKNEFIVNEANMTISFAGKEFNNFRMLDKASQAMDAMAYWPGTVAGVRPARAFSDEYEITPAKFVKVHNALMMKLWIAPIEDHVNRFGYTCMKKISPHIVKAIWNSKEIIEQAQKDGNYNIAPWIIKTGQSPKELKESMGKSVWKNLCKQSMTRNKFLAFSGNRIRYDETDLQTASEIPSYILKCGNQAPFPWSDATIWAIKNKLLNSKSLSSRKTLREILSWVDAYRDTKRMAPQVGKGFNPNWKPDVLERKHAEYINLINLKKYSPEPFECLKDFKHKVFQYKGFTATILDSPALVRGEGEAMHHCVGGYSDMVAAGNYLVYSVTKDGKRSSTIAFMLHKDQAGLSSHTEWQFNQHYGYCNAYIEDKDELEFKDIILKEVNK